MSLPGPGRSLLERAPCLADDAASGPLRLGVLVSGGGSNLQAILDAAPSSAFRVACVVSNVPEAYALTRAAAAGVPTVVETHRGRDRAVFEEAVSRHLAAHGVEVVVLAGFMRVLTTAFLARWPIVVNVHPALLPAFPGTHGAAQALRFGARVAGCTVHLVDDGVDTGPILAQAAVPVLDEDDEATLQRRIQAEEHRLLPAVLDALARGDVRVLDDGRVRVFGLAART